VQANARIETVLAGAGRRVGDGLGPGDEVGAIMEGAIELAGEFSGLRAERRAAAFEEDHGNDAAGGVSANEPNQP